MSEVAAVLAQAAVTHLMSAHVELEVLLELADLGVFQGGGTHDVDQTPAAGPEKYEAPEDQLSHIGLGRQRTQKISSGRGKLPLGKQNPCPPTLYQP